MPRGRRNRWKRLRRVRYLARRTRGDMSAARRGPRTLSRRLTRRRIERSIARFLARLGLRSGPCRGPLASALLKTGPKGGSPA
jgi:hypothetical protein